MKAMIFAAGLGTRLRPLTDIMPKALVPVAGKPLLLHQIEKLNAAGFNDITVNIHHFPEMMKEFIGTADIPGCSISISDESESLLETGGGLKHAEKHLRGCGPILLHNVDILSDADLTALYRHHRHDFLATLLVSERATSRYLLFRNEGNAMRLCGWTDTRTSEVRTPFQELVRGSDANATEGVYSFRLTDSTEKNETSEAVERYTESNSIMKYAFSGIHTVSESIFRQMDGMPERFSITDFYLKKAASCIIAAETVPGLRILDVGKTDTLETAEKFLSSLP